LEIDRLVHFLRHHRRIALDTSVFIYQLEANVRYLPFTDQIFAWLECPGHEAVTSAITMTELLVHPYREADQQRMDELYGVVSTYPNLDWIAPDLEIASLAASLRAQHHLKTADALQAATAMRAEASGFVTNDRGFKRLDIFETLILDELL
jgi:predicted nucleic acid-binding protein